IFVKKGTIIPMMPVMQFIHEDPEHPLFIHVFPNYEDEQAAFTLYEDDGESLDYLKDVYATTTFTCTTTATGWDTEVTCNDQGYTPQGGRGLLLHYHLERRPTQVVIDGKTVNELNGMTAQELIASSGSVNGWVWDEEQPTCIVKTKDSRKA